MQIRQTVHHRASIAAAGTPTATRRQTSGTEYRMALTPPAHTGTFLSIFILDEQSIGALA
jgi:hypothetical protein